MSEDKSQFPRIEKNAMRQITNNSKNKLASRLYRNSSLNHIHPNTSMLSSSIYEIQPSFLNSSASNNSQLVASISLKKFKKKVDNQPYLSINNGKLLINKGDSYFTCERSPKETGRRMFKKLDKLTHPMNKILPDDLIDFPIEKQLFQESRCIKKANLSPSKTQKNRCSDDKEDLLPQDFIQLLEEDRNITNEFCYLKKMDHPYDLKIIEFDKNLEKKSESSSMEYPSQYITISSRGVTYFSQDQSRFVTLQEWKKQANYFKKIIKLNFFKNFKLIKNFSNWKKYLRKSAMKSTVQKLKEVLVYNDLYLSKSLLKIKQICYSMETDVSFCRFDDCQKVHDIKQFRASHQVFLVNQFERKISELEQNIKEVLITNMSISMKQFKQQNKISSSMEGKGMPLLIGDQKNLEMPYTKQATLRTQQEKFQKFVKLVDIIITHSKVNMMAESTETVAKKLQEDNYNYQRQVISSNYKNNYKGKQYLQCVLTLDPKEQTLYLKPTRDDLSMLFEDIVSRSVVRVCRYHKKISSDIDILSIIYDSQEQFPKESESQNLKAIMTSDNRQQKMQKDIMVPINISYNYVLNYIEKFRKISKFYFQNMLKLEQIQSFQPRDYEAMGNYLDSWQKQKQEISQVANQHEGALFQLNLKQFKDQTERLTDTCIRKIKTLIPQIYEASANQLEKQLTEARLKVNRRPVGIEAIMLFNEDVQKNMNQQKDYQQQKFQLEFLENLIVSPSNSDQGVKKVKKTIHPELQGLRDDLKTAWDYIQAYKIKAQEEVKLMKSNSKLIIFYSQIKQLIQEEKTSEQMLSFVKKKRTQFTEIRKQFCNINTYEKFLGLQESDSSEIQVFENYFNAFEKIWITVNQFQEYSQNILSKTCKQIKTSEVFTKLEQFSNTIAELKKIVSSSKDKDSRFQYSQNDQNVLDNVFEQLEKTFRPLIETIQCLNQTNFSEKQWKQIRLVLATRSPQILKVLEVDKNERKVIDLMKFQAQKQLPFLQTVASKSKRNTEIVKKLESIKNYTNYTKQHQGLFRNLTEKFKSQVGNFLQDIDEKIMMANYVLQYSQNNQSERAKAEKNTLEKLRQILILWDQYEQHVQYFEPIYINSDWKNTHEAKNYILATEQNWKKTYKGFKDSTFSKILTAERIIPSLKQSNQMLQSLYPAVKNYFNLKRQQCPRLNFISDSEILKIYLENKDFKGLNNYVNKLFSGVSQLRIKQEEQLPYEAVNMDGQTIPLKIMRTPNFEVEQMLKSTDQFLKNSIKASLKTCHYIYDTEEFNKQAWIQDNILQALVFVTNVYFTRIIENDYMGNERQDKKKLLYYHLSQLQNLEQFLSSHRNTQLYSKISVLLTQAILIRDIIYYLIAEQIQSKQSYGWLKQVRSYYNPGPPQQAYNQYLNVPISYGNQFVCMKSNPILIASTNQKMTIQLINSIFNCNIVPFAAKGLFTELANFNAKPHNCVFLSAQSQSTSLRNIIEGTWLTGSFTDIFLSDQLNEGQLKTIANTIHQVQLAITLKQPYLRGFKSLCLNRQACISLISPDLNTTCLPLLEKKYFEYRVFTPQQVSWQAYISLILEINNLKIPNIANKLGKTLNYLENTFSNFKINKSQVKSLIQEMEFDRQNEVQLAKRVLKRIFKKQYKAAEKKLISKLFLDVFGVAQTQKLVSSKSIREANICEFQVNRLVAILKQNRACILTGANTEFKHFIAYELYKYFSEKESQPKPTVLRNKDLNNLLGQYQNNKWIEGTISKKVRQNFNKKQCFIIVGSCTQLIMKMLEQLNQSKSSFNYINLSNGQKFRLGPQHKILALFENQFRDSLFDGFNVKTIDFEAIKFQPEEILEYLIHKKVFPMKKATLCARYFVSHPQSLTSLQNMYFNNLQKVGNSNLKMLGHRSDYNQPNLIMSRFVTLFNACLAYDKDKICQSNSKMMQKLYIWCLHWSVGSCLPGNTLEKLDKLFDTIKIQYDKSQSLSESKLFISERNKTVSKFIKQKRVFQKRNKQNFLITQDLEAKKELIKILIQENTTIMLIGERYSGKSSYIEYLESVFRSEGYNTFKTKITKETSFDKFLHLIKKNSIIQYFPSSQAEKYKLCSRVGKKMVIFVDNFNLIDADSEINNFFETATLYQYYYDPTLRQKVYLNNVCFICAKNDEFEDFNRQVSYPLQYFPIYVNLAELGQIMNSYTQDFKKEEEVKNSKSDIVSKTLSSIATLHLFINNLINSEKTGDKIPLSYEIALWIGKQILNCANDKNSCAQEMLGLWKYLTIKKYIESGIVKRFEDQIIRQVSNLSSLIVKSLNENESFLKKQTQLIKSFDLEKSAMDLYIFFAYLLKSDQYKNLITKKCQTPAGKKSLTLKKICQQYSFDFIHYKGQQVNLLKNNSKQLVIYIEGKNQNLPKIIEFMIEQSENNKLVFVIDFASELQFNYYLRFFPCIKNLAHIIEHEEYQKKVSLQIKYYEATYQILRSVDGFSQELVSEVLQKNPNAFEQLLENRMSQLLKGKKNIQYLQSCLNECKTQCEKLQLEIENVTLEQEKAQQKKNNLINEIEQYKLKNKSTEDPKFIEKKQQANKSISLIDTELRRLKNLKKQLRELQIKNKQSSKDKQEIFISLEKFDKNCRQSLNLCERIKVKTKTLQIISVLHVFLNIFYEQKNLVAKQVIEIFANNFCQSQFSVNFSSIYEVLLRTKITDVLIDESIIRWHFSNFKGVFVTNYPDQLVEKLQSSNPEARQCCNQYDYNQYVKTRPIFVKDLQYFGEAQVTLIVKDRKSLKQAKQSTLLTFVPSQQEMRTQYKSKIYNLISELMGQSAMSERSAVQNQLKKIQLQHTNFVTKFNNKMYVETSQFSTVNSLAQIKMLSQGISSLAERIKSSHQKLCQIESANKKYSKIMDTIELMQNYLKIIAEMYPYSNINEKHLTEVLTKSMTILQTQIKVGQPVVEEGKQDKQTVEIKKQLLVDQSVYKIEDKICHWVFYNLSPLDSVYACFIFACLKAKKEKYIQEWHLNLAADILKGKSVENFNIISLPQLDYLLKSIIENPQDKIHLLIDFVEKRLKFDFKKMLNCREQWLSSLNNLFNKRVQQAEQCQSQTQKLFVVVKCSASNGYKLIDKQIRKHLTNDQTVIYLLESDSIEHKIQALEKSSGNTQGWIVLECSSNINKINRLIQYVVKNRNYCLVLYFDNEKQLAQINSKFFTTNYYQICLYEKSSSISHQIVRILNKYNIENISKQAKQKKTILQNQMTYDPTRMMKKNEQESSNSDAIKMLKIVSIQLIQKTLFNFVYQQEQANSYIYRIFQILAKRVSQVSLQDIIQFSIDFFFDPSKFQNRHFLKEAKRVYNQLKSYDQFDDNFNNELYATVSLQSFNQLKERFEREDKIKEFCTKFMQESFMDKIQIDQLLGFVQKKKRHIVKQEKTINRARSHGKMNTMLQKVPILGKLQDSDKNMSLCSQMLRTEKKSIQIQYSKKLEQVKRLSKILESKRSLTIKTEEQIFDATEQVQDTTEKLLKLHSKLSLIQKLIETKDPINLALTLELINKPKEFLHAFLLQNQNLTKVDWANFRVQLKCINQKERQLLKDSIQKGQYILLNNLKLCNARHDSHKNFIECFGKSESSRLSNVVLYIGKIDSLPYAKRIPLMVKNMKICEFSIVSKAKQTCFFSPEPYVIFVDKQQQKKK